MCQRLDGNFMCNTYLCDNTLCLLFLNSHWTLRLFIMVTHFSCLLYDCNCIFDYLVPYKINDIRSWSSSKSFKSWCQQNVDWFMRALRNLYLEWSWVWFKFWQKLGELKWFYSFETSFIRESPRIYESYFWPLMQKVRIN